jgi:hypothetical protein
MRCTALVVVAACSSAIDAAAPPIDAAAPPLDARSLDSVDLQMIREARRVGAFQRADRAPYLSSVGSFDIDVFVSQDARNYRRIHPETTGSGVVLSPGTLIVREVLDAQGQVTKITLMAKQRAGYDPTLGDWWFGVTDPAGQPLGDASGPQVGRLTECHGCHLPRAQDDYLFGVPKTDQ